MEGVEMIDQLLQEAFEIFDIIISEILTEAVIEKASEK
jgi:hypothetical protein